MSVQPKPGRMTVDDFLAWADGRDRRYELVDGEIVAMSPERVRHAEAKAAVFVALRAAIRKGSLTCRALIDGVAVRIDRDTSYVPDVLVHCGDRLDPDAVEVVAPIIVVEVVSPSSTSIDTGRKLSGYFRVASIVHYLIVDPVAPIVIHHRRSGGGGIETRILATGTLDLDPPGLGLAVADLFADP